MPEDPKHDDQQQQDQEVALDDLEPSENTKPQGGSTWPRAGAAVDVTLGIDLQ